MKVVLLSERAKVPQRAKKGDAGCDLFCPEDQIIFPGRNLIPLGIAIQLDPHTEAQIRPRSGFSLKGIEGYVDNPENNGRFDADVLIGTIDEGYVGEVGVIIKSYETQPFTIKSGTKIAQMVISHYVDTPFEIADKLNETERGVNGFGHTGTM